MWYRSFRHFCNSSVSAHRIRELVELPKEVHISESEELDPFAEDGFEVLMKDVNFSDVEGARARSRILILKRVRAKS